MTTLKFRAWDKKNKKMFTVMMIDFGQSYVMVKEPNGLWSERDFDEVELMQFTGLFDKNGREIFESDIVKVLNSLYTVFYDSEKGSFRLKPHDKRWHTDYMSNFSHGGNFEVIGNMYENPELLEVKER